MSFLQKRNFPIKNLKYGYQRACEKNSVNSTQQRSSMIKY